MKVSNTIKPLALILCAIALTACATPSQLYWDHRVKELCEKDGGVTVYEKVEISKADYPNLKFTSGGYVILTSKDNSKPDDPFFSTSNTEVLQEGPPEIRRYEQSIVRRRDSKILSKLISYSRIGGDIPTGISHPSHYSCEDLDSNIRIYSSTITVKGE